MAEISKIQPIGSSTQYDLSALKIKVNSTSAPSSATTYRLMHCNATDGYTEVGVTNTLGLWRDSTSNYLVIGNNTALGGVTLQKGNGKYADLIPGALTANRTITFPDASGTVLLANGTGNTSQFLRGDNTWSYKLEGNDGSTALGVINTYSSHTSSNIWLYSSSSMGLMWTSTSSYDSTRKKIIALSSDKSKVYSDFPMTNSNVIGGAYITGSHAGSFYVDTATTAATGQFFQSWYGGKTPSGSWGIGDVSGYNDLFFVYGTDSNYNSNTNTASTIHFGYDGKVYGAVWNDYAEFRKENPKEKEQQTPGRCVHELGNGTLALTTKRLERGCEIISDTYGFAIGENKDNGYTVPIASTGRVLAYPYESIEEFAAHIGWPVCSGPNGTISIMTEEEEEKYPSRIIGTISEIPDYEEWGSGNVKVNSRVWIRIR